MFKLRTVFCFILVVYLISSCKKLNKPNGYIKLNFDNKQIILPLIYFEKNKNDNKTISLSFDNSEDHYSESESIYLNELEKLQGKKTFLSFINPERIFNWCSVENGDLVEGCRRIDTSALDSNWIEITETNKRFTNIKGKMQAVLKVSTGNRWGPPGTRIFLTGEFSARK